MKRFRHLIFLFVVLSLLFVACGDDDDDDDSSSGDDDDDDDNDDNNDDDNDTGPDPLDLDFTNPPIDLEGIDAQFAQDISYGDYADNVFDVFLPNATEYTPLVIYIHGGGFTGGEKEAIYSGTGPEEIRTYLENGFAFATIDYRLLQTVDDEGVIKPLSDSKRCLQFIRYHHDCLNIDPDQVALYGSSAGAGTSLWIALSDDMAEAESEDPVLRQSTRVQAAAAIETQGSYDLVKWQDVIFADFPLINLQLIAAMDPDLKQRMLSFYGITEMDQLYTPEIIEYRAKVDMLGIMSADDPGIWVKNENEELDMPLDIGALFHHPFHAKALKDQADIVGIENIIYIPKMGIVDPSGEGFENFLMGHCQ